MASFSFRRRLPVLLVLVLAIPSVTLAADRTLHDLARIDAFAFGGIGAAGTISPGEVAFREILAGPHPLDDFQHLLAKGNVQAKCYALVAIHVLDPAVFKTAAAHFERNDTPVKTIGGCMIVTQPLHSVVTTISKGDYDRYLTPPHK